METGRKQTKAAITDQWDRMTMERKRPIGVSAATRETLMVSFQTENYTAYYSISRYFHRGAIVSFGGEKRMEKACYLIVPSSQGSSYAQEKRSDAWLGRRRGRSGIIR